MECEIAAHGAPYCTRSSSKKKKKTILQRDQRARKGEGRGENGEEEGKGPAGLEPVRASWRGASVRAPAAWDLVAERMRPGVHAGTLGRVGRSCPGLGLSDKLCFLFLFFWWW